MVYTQADGFGPKYLLRTGILRVRGFITLLVRRGMHRVYISQEAQCYKLHVRARLRWRSRGNVVGKGVTLPYVSIIYWPSLGIRGDMRSGRDDPAAYYHSAIRPTLGSINKCRAKECPVTALSRGHSLLPGEVHS